MFELTLIIFLGSQQKLIENLVKIQNDGRVEVDWDSNAPVASHLLELQSVEGSTIILDDKTSDINKLVPRLKIAILVVGTRGDVQPFLAMAKRLQARLNYLVLLLIFFSPATDFSIHVKV